MRLNQIERVFAKASELFFVCSENAKQAICERINIVWWKQVTVVTIVNQVRKCHCVGSHNGTTRCHRLHCCDRLKLSNRRHGKQSCTLICLWQLFFGDVALEVDLAGDAVDGSAHRIHTNAPPG